MGKRARYAVAAGPVSALASVPVWYLEWWERGRGALPLQSDGSRVRSGIGSGGSGTRLVGPATRPPDDRLSGVLWTSCDEQPGCSTRLI